jgi:hypothetical protein
VREIRQDPGAEAGMAFGEPPAVRAGEVDVAGDLIARRRLVPPLEQDPRRYVGRPFQVGELRQGAAAHVPAGQGGPERALGAEVLRRDVQA